MPWEMDPVVLATTVGGGVSLVVALTWLVGWSARATVGDEADVRARFAREHPGQAPGEVRVADDGHAALIALPEARVAVVFALGDRLVTRVVGGDGLRAVEVRAGTLHLRLRDFSTPRVRVTLGPDADAWAARFRGAAVAP